MRQTRILESRTLAGRFRGGYLAPVMAHAFKSNEGGMLSQTAMIELDPVAGRLITPVTGQMFSVYVPVQAMAALANPSDPNAGVTELLRQKLLNGDVLFPLEAENELSKRMGVMPVSIGGVKQVSAAARLAHNCAINYLRKRVYTYAAQIAGTNVAVTPALLSSTVLDRFNAVLNPDEHINGVVNFEVTASGERLPLANLYVANQSQGTIGPVDVDGKVTTPTLVNSRQLFAKANGSGPDILPIYAELNQTVPAEMRLTDLYAAETMDQLTRKMRAIIDQNPVDGEEQVLRWAYGLQVDTLQDPFLLHQSEVIFGQDLMRAMDGAGIEAEVTQSRLMQRLQTTVPVPRTELGGVVVTFLAVKPDETIYEQPHPVLSKPWVADNLMAEELQLDPVPVLAREVQAGVAQADEATVCFYTGYNELRRTYVNYGWNRAVDPATVDAKNAMWQLEIPASVTPENIVYPENIPQYPFLDQDAEIARYQVTSVLNGMSPIFVGPSPVETVSVITDEDLFEQGTV